MPVVQRGGLITAEIQALQVSPQNKGINVFPKSGSLRYETVQYRVDKIVHLKPQRLGRSLRKKRGRAKISEQHQNRGNKNIRASTYLASSSRPNPLKTMPKLCSRPAVIGLSAPSIDLEMARERAASVCASGSIVKAFASEKSSSRQKRRALAKSSNADATCYQKTEGRHA